MKNTRLIPVIDVMVSVMLSACSGFNLAPAAARVASAFALPANAAKQSIPVSAPATTKSETANPQTGIDVIAQQSIYETVYQNVNPSVVTIVISSQASSLNSSHGGSQGNGQTPKQ